MPAAFDGLGRALRFLRLDRDLRQYEVAAGAGISKSMLSAYEVGKQRPNVATLEKVLTALGVDLETLARTLRVVRGEGSDPPVAARLEPLDDEETASLEVLHDALTKVLRRGREGDS